MEHFKRIKTEDGGGVIVFVALSMAVMISSMALAIDIGMLLTARSEAQRAADSSALSAASAYLEFDPETDPVGADSAARARAYDLALQNAIRAVAIDSSEVTPEPILDEYKVRVTVRRQAVGLWFARLFGIDSWDVAGMAVAEAALAGSATCVKPIMIPDMWVDTNDDDIKVNKWWDFDLDPGCNNANCGNELWAYDGDDYYDNEETGYGSSYRDGEYQYLPNGDSVAYTQDDGRRVPLKVQVAQGGNVTSFWYPWVMPGSSNSGINGWEENLGGCRQFSVGDSVQTMDAETKNGISSKPIYDAFKDSLIAKDPLAFWNDDTNQVEYYTDPNCTTAGCNSEYRETWTDSPRVFDIVVFNPEHMRQGKQYYEVVNFGRFFLEDPLHVYPNATGQPFHLPITGRILKFAEGKHGPEEGSLIRTLRLVE